MRYGCSVVLTVLVGFTVSPAAGASGDPFVGSRTVTLFGDDNISDGVQLDSHDADVTVSTDDGLIYTVTATRGGDSLSLTMGRSGDLLTQSPRPQGTTVNSYLFSDGAYGIFLLMGQEVGDPLDISIRVATWGTDSPVSPSQLVGDWEIMWIDDTNLLSNPSEPFTVESRTLTITDLGGGQVGVQMGFGGSTWVMQINGNTLEPIPGTVDAPLVHLSVMTDGHRIAIAMLAVEPWDPTDVSATIGFSTRRRTLLQDDFTDGVADGWNEILGTWSVLGGEYVGVSEDPQNNRDMLATIGDPCWADYTFSARMKLVPPESQFNDFGLVFYAQGDEFMRFTLGAEVDVSPPTARISHQVYNVSGGEYEGVAELAHHVSEPAMVVGQWYDISLCLYEGHVSAYVDGRLVAYADNLPLTHGYVGLMADTPTAFFDDIVVTTGTNVFFPDYMPLTVNEHGVKTFEWTYGQTGEYTSAIGGSETVPYGSGPLTGVTITNHSDWGATIVSNDGACVKFLGGGDWYLSTDTSLSAHPPGYALASLSDGMIIDQGEYYNVSKNLSNWERVDDQMLLIDIQDVTVPQGHHVNAVVIWYLDTDFAFAPIDFHGKELALGLALPTSADMAGYAATAVEIYALGTGQIAQGDIDAATGSVNNLAELKEVVDPTWVPHDWNGDGFVSIIGDVPPFVQCVYFEDCSTGVDPVTVGDCNNDGILSIVGDVPCFVQCVYFGNCPE